MLRSTRATFCAYRAWAAGVREEWTVKHKKNNPFFMGMDKRYWEAIPEMPEGCHVMDVAGMFQDDDGFRKVNDMLKSIREDTGVDVRMYLLGDVGSYVTKDLAKRLGSHRNANDAYENTLTIVVSRKNGTLDTYPGCGVSLIFNPYWLHKQFKAIFKVYFKGREWDVKLTEYAEEISKTITNNRTYVQRSGRPVFPFLFKYWWAILAALAITFIKTKEYVEYWRYWDKRWCPDCRKFMEGFEDKERLLENLTLGQKKEVELDCVQYALWACPTDGCSKTFVEEVKWNSLRNDCLICVKCRHRTSWGRRVVGAIPDTDNQGEAINMRTCRFCGFEEAWLSLIPANMGRNNDPEHDRQTVGTYGSAWERTFRSSFLGKFVFPGEGSPAAEIRKGGVGELSDKTNTYFHK
eukprot:TRINITY_DN6920_c1_g1_i1.p1 TRINITY_DN6920_c1_g1~~TRINITY_DN6920_c1_g1_i1.p1  ORF type:complete len:407 (+),score=70.92 TRINITY_DN6920_c1_g1_i1:227-1447(+)